MAPMTPRKAKKDLLPLGRPSEYKPEYAQMMVDYFAKTYEDVPVEGGMTRREYLPFPTLARFATNIGVCRDTLHHWSTVKNEDGSLKFPDFADAYKKSKDFQEANLVEGTLSGRYQSTFAIFTSKNVLGWRDKVETEHTGKDGGPIQTESNVKLDPSETYLRMLNTSK